MADSAAPADDPRQVRNLNALLEVSKALASAFRLDDLLLLIVEKTTEVMEADRSSLFLYDEQTSEIWTKIAQGVTLKEIRLPVGVGIAGDVAKTRKGANIPDAYEDSRFNPGFDKKTGYRTRSVLCLPMMNSEGKLVGVVQVLNKKDGRAFDGQDEELLAALGAHAAVALEQARLIEAFVEKQRMEASLKLAQTIQMSMLPTESPTVEGFEVHGWSVACDETGGDYFDYLDLPDGRLGLVIGDVSGHGLGAAMYMATARAALRSLTMNEEDPATILYQLNKRLENDMHEGNFMTLFFGILDPESRTMRYTSAGHDEPLLYRAADESFLALESTGMPLGMMDDMDFPEGQTTLFEEGDVLLLATDGVLEAMDEREEQLGRDRMQQTLADYHDRSAEEITAAVRECTYEFMGNAPQRDDITIVTIKAVSPNPDGGESGDDDLDDLDFDAIDIVEDAEDREAGRGAEPDEVGAEELQELDDLDELEAIEDDPSAGGLGEPKAIDDES